MTVQSTLPFAQPYVGYVNRCEGSRHLLRIDELFKSPPTQSVTAFGTAAMRQRGPTSHLGLNTIHWADECGTLPRSDGTGYICAEIFLHTIYHCHCVRVRRHEQHDYTLWTRQSGMPLR